MNDSIRNELDLRTIDQLHAAILERSGNCFELKKLCTTILISATVLLASFTHQKLGYGIFIGAALTIVFFWLLDSQSYFYQEKMRSIMNLKAQAMLPTQSQPTQSSAIAIGIPMASFRIADTRIRRSLLNSSMLFYLLLTLIDVVLTVLYAFDIIPKR